MKSLRLTALAAGLVLAACASPAPTDPALLDSAAPSFDEGPGMDGGVGTTGSGGDATTSDTGGTTTSSDSSGAQRGGGMLGSGN